MVHAIDNYAWFCRMNLELVINFRYKPVWSIKLWMREKKHSEMSQRMKNDHVCHNAYTNLTSPRKGFQFVKTVISLSWDIRVEKMIWYCV